MRTRVAQRALISGCEERIDLRPELVEQRFESLREVHCLRHGQSLPIPSDLFDQYGQSDRVIH
ncbi:MAG: hypothetical protein WBE26_00450 [Phycisphaerae bacterium]